MNYYDKKPSFGESGSSKIKEHFRKGITVFLIIGACIICYFAFLRFDYISEVLADAQLNMNTSSALSSYYLTLTDLERISDYAVSMEKQAKKFSNAIYNKELLVEMKETVKEMQDNLYDLDKAQTKNKEIHQQVKQWRKNQISALKDKQVSSEIGVMLSRLLTDYKRINDHALNIAEELSGNTI